jgi:hypothetical protein
MKLASVRAAAIGAGAMLLVGVTVAAEAPVWPTHSHIRPSGGWECDRGYEERSGECLLIEVPLNAHLSAGGHYWQCDPSFRLLEESCVKPVPEIQSFRHSG